MNSFMRLLIIIEISFDSVIGAPLFLTESLTLFPKNEFEYFNLRDQLLFEEKIFEGRNFLLSQEEKIVNDYLGHLKWLDMLRTKNTGFTPSRPIEEIVEQVQTTELYKVLKKLPKGGNVHSHEDHQLSKRTLFEIIWASEDFKHLYMIDPTKNTSDPWTMDFFINPPPEVPWIKVKESRYSLEDILKQNTLMGLMTQDDINNPTDASKRWDRINPLWGRASTQLIANVKIKRKYLEAILKQSFSEGVSYIEGRRGFGLDLNLYELDGSGNSNETYGKKFIDPNCTKEIELSINVTEEFKKENPGFIDYKRISYTVRFLDYKTFESNMNLTVKLHRKYPTHLIGFDAVAEEDQGYSSLHYISQYLSLQKDGTKMIPLYLHTAETSWPDDLISGSLEDDPVPTLQNAYESVLLNVRRVGHGKGFVKKPYLMQMLKKLGIAVEVCIISNQILGMEPDLRNHFGQMLHKHGVPIILSPDGPGTFGYDNFTIDWYQAYVGWGLNLGDLKQFALNSLTYNGMTNEERTEAIYQKWLPSWKNFVKNLSSEVCEKNLTSEAIAGNRNVTFIRSYPDVGRKYTKIHIYGRNFERAICKSPKCQIGKVSSSVVYATYESNQYLTCVVPDCPTCVGKSVPIYVDLDGLGMVPTNLTFEYVKEETVSRMSVWAKSIFVYMTNVIETVYSTSRKDN